MMQMSMDYDNKLTLFVLFAFSLCSWTCTMCRQCQSTLLQIYWKYRVPLTIYPKEMAVALKRCIFDPMLVKPKCVWEVADFLKNCKQTAEKCKQILENWKNLPPLKHILALPTWGQILIFSELQPFEISIFQMKHPVYD